MVTAESKISLKNPRLQSKSRVQSGKNIAMKYLARAIAEKIESRKFPKGQEEECQQPS